VTDRSSGRDPGTQGKLAVTPKVVVERSGGFAGIKRRGERERDALSPQQRAALEEIMARPSSFPPDPGADRFTYRVEVQDENGIRSVTVPESALPQVLKDIASP
jgi:hypothetical protein